MKNEIQRIEDTAFVGPVTGPDDPPRISELKRSDAEFPCPQGDGDDCKTADWLTSRERAGLVYLYLDTLAPARRTSDQQNDLGIALAWAGDWEGAAEAFEAAKTNATSAERRRAAHNAKVAARAKRAEP